MIRITGKEVRERRIPLLLKEREGRDLSFYLFSNPKDKSSFYYLKGVKKVLDLFAIPYEEDFLDEKDIPSSLERFQRKAREKDTILARPLHIPQENLFLDSISPLHDPDMTRRENVGRLFLGNLDFLPATAKSVRWLLEDYRISLSGKKVLIVGRSRTIGLPLYALASHLDAFVQVAHSKVPLSEIRKAANESDVVFLASGKRLLSKEDFSPESIVIDCGYHEDGKGDLGFVPEEGDLQAYTPVPGGVGVLTSYCLIENSIVLDKIRRQD